MLPHPNLDRSVMKRNQARVLHLNKNKKMSIFRKKKTFQVHGRLRVLKSLLNISAFQKLCQ